MAEGRRPRALCRASDAEVERWQAEAAKSGLTLSEHVRSALDAAPRVAQVVEMLAKVKDRTGVEDRILRLLDPVRWERETR